MQKQKLEVNAGTALELTQIENTVSGIWAEVLQVDRVNPEDNFFELGGDSLMTMMVLFRVNEMMQVDMPPYTISQAPTLREFCQKVDEQRAESESEILPEREDFDDFAVESGVI